MKRAQNNTSILIGAVIVMIVGMLVFFWQNPGSFEKFAQIFNGVPAEYYEFTIHNEQIPKYKNKSFYEVNGDEPFFTESEKNNVKAKEQYYDLDSLGRATGAYAVVSKQTMPKESREQLSYKPTGWKQAQYTIGDKTFWLYNRCHLIGFQLTGENDNAKNLITGTRQFNTVGMLPFETQVAQYVDRYNGRCLYRVTPYYEGKNLVAAGVLMESYSIERPDEATFCVFVYNVQDGVEIDYESGDSKLAGD